MIGDILQPTHLLLVLIVALVVLGPKRLPEVAKTLGSGLRDFRSAISGEDHDRDTITEAPSQPVTDVAETTVAVDESAAFGDEPPDAEQVSTSDPASVSDAIDAEDEPTEPQAPSQPQSSAAPDAPPEPQAPSQPQSSAAPDAPPEPQAPSQPQSSAAPDAAPEPDGPPGAEPELHTDAALAPEHRA